MLGIDVGLASSRSVGPIAIAPAKHSRSDGGRSHEPGGKARSEPPPASSGSPERSIGFSQRETAWRSMVMSRQPLVGLMGWSSRKKPCVARCRMRGERMAFSG